MKVFYKVALFCLAVIGAYTLFSVYYVPPISTEQAPHESSAEASRRSDMSVQELSALGARLYTGKGACALCHNQTGARAPLLDDIANVARARLLDPAYKGRAKDVREYVIESLVEPSAYVARGFGVAGTNDRESPMPDVRTGAIGLDNTEVGAIVEYLLRDEGKDAPDEMKGANR